MKRVLRNIAIGCSIVFATIELACAQSTSSHLKDKFVYNFGTISEDTTIVYGHLDYTNTCNDNLIITRLIPSCSCVEAQATDTVIKPGQKCRINFSFKPLNYPGHIDKQIYIYTNQDQNTSTETLYLTGVVTPTTNPIHEYRFSFGKLYVKQKQVRFNGVTDHQVERISCYNLSDESLSLSVASANIPKGVSFSTNPYPIPPHTKAELVFSFDPTSWKVENEKSYQLPIEGYEYNNGIKPVIQINIQQ